MVLIGKTSVKNKNSQSNETTMQESCDSMFCNCKWIALLVMLFIRSLLKWYSAVPSSCTKAKHRTVVLLPHGNLKEFEICAISNSYLTLAPKYQLADTEKDVDRIRTTMFRETGKQYKNLSGNQFMNVLEKTLSVASKRQTHCAIYLSMHGMGGRYSEEYLIGDDGKFISEGLVRQSFEINGRNAKSVIAIIDACHSGGLFNMCHTYSYDANGEVSKISELSDTLGESEPSCVDSELPPCFVITAVQEHQSAQLTTAGSVFTNEIATAIQENPTGTSVYTILRIVAKQCSYFMQMHDLPETNPVCSFNTSFYRRIQHETGISCPEDVLHCIALV